jgi:hypothetical protein
MRARALRNLVLLSHVVTLKDRKTDSYQQTALLTSPSVPVWVVDLRVPVSVNYIITYNKSSLIKHPRYYVPTLANGSTVNVYLQRMDCVETIQGRGLLFGIFKWMSSKSIHGEGTIINRERLLSKIRADIQTHKRWQIPWISIRRRSFVRVQP